MKMNFKQMFVMKKVLLLIAFLTIMLFSAEFDDSKSNFRQGTQLEFGLNYIAFNFGKTCSLNYINCVTDEYGPLYGFAYYSTLDTNFAVFVNVYASRITIFNVHTGPFFEERSVSLSQILKQEFINLQEWDVVNISKDSASHLIDRIVYNMLECKVDMADIYNANDMVSVYTHIASCDTFECCAEPTDGGTAMIENWWTLLPEKKPTSIFPKTATSCLRISRLRPGVFYGEGFPQATPYKVFDVNGILLKQGITENGQIYVPKTPSILDIEHKKVLLK